MHLIIQTLLIGLSIDGLILAWTLFTESVINIPFNGIKLINGINYK